MFHFFVTFIELCKLNWRRFMHTGVFLAKKKDGTIYYRSSFTHKSKHISLGSYATEELAHKAYTEATNIINSTNKLLITDYNKKKRFLSFEKWVVLVNLKDNGIYFKTPIYLHPKYFEYYLDNDPFAPLKFDADDLFFYSTHKIMRRGGHLFVADYGMQINILNRYGIKNFAVPGKDYIFVNGDNTDYRYQNIKIINRYTGVTTQETSNNQTIYIAKIHINGDHIIGRYSNEKEAAIAYNKAADILKNNGFTINFQTNYIEAMNGDEYTEIYNTVKIAKKLNDLRPTK